MSKKIFSVQDWENVPSEILQTHTPDIVPICNKVKDDVESVVREIEQRGIDIAPIIRLDGVGLRLLMDWERTDGSIIIASADFTLPIKGKKQINNIRIVCNPKGKALLSVLSSIWQIKLEFHWLHPTKSIYPFCQISKMAKRANG